MPSSRSLGAWQSSLPFHRRWSDLSLPAGSELCQASEVGHLTRLHNLGKKEYTDQHRTSNSIPQTPQGVEVQKVIQMGEGSYKEREEQQAKKKTSLQWRHHEPGKRTVFGREVLTPPSPLVGLVPSSKGSGRYREDLSNTRRWSDLSLPARRGIRDSSVQGTQLSYITVAFVKLKLHPRRWSDLCLPAGVWALGKARFHSIAAGRT